MVSLAERGEAAAQLATSGMDDFLVQSSIIGIDRLNAGRQIAHLNAVSVDSLSATEASE